MTGSGLPAPAAAEVVRLVGHYLRSTPPRRLPPPLRPLRNFRPPDLLKRRSVVLAALDDDGFRTGLLEWLDDRPLPLSTEESDTLRIAAERPEGWAELVVRRVGQPPSADEPSPDEDDLEARLARAEERLERARADLRRARADATRDASALEAEAASLRTRLEAAEAERRTAAAERDDARAAAAAARSEADRALRRARRDTAEARARADEARRELKAAVRARDAVEERVRRLEADLTALRKRGGGRTARDDEPGPSRGRGPRREPLPVPKGRLPEDPQTLDEWLSADGVALVVDGYNVTKDARGFGTLPLEGQRERLIDRVGTFVARKGVPTTIVFDGSEVAPAATGRRRGRVKVEYSAPHETADDHIVASLRRLRGPVVLVTSDRDLQGRAAALGATIATSDQLLTLIR